MTSANAGEGTSRVPATTAPVLVAKVSKTCRREGWLADDHAAEKGRVIAQSATMQIAIENLVIVAKLLHNNMGSLRITRYHKEYRAVMVISQSDELVS